MSVATAGVTSFFKMQARAEYMNNRKTRDSGMRASEPGTAKLAHYGALTFTSATVVTLSSASLDTYPPGASVVEQAYKGFRLYLDGKENHDEWRTIVDYTIHRVTTLDGPFTTITSGSAAYKVMDLVSPDSRAVEAFRHGILRSLWTCRPQIV